MKAVVQQLEVEIVPSSDQGKYRMIVYVDEDMLQSSGYKFTRKELYDLYSQLREIFGAE